MRADAAMLQSLYEEHCTDVSIDPSPRLLPLSQPCTQPLVAASKVILMYQGHAYCRVTVVISVGLRWYTYSMCKPRASPAPATSPVTFRLAHLAASYRFGPVLENAAELGRQVQ